MHLAETYSLNVPLALNIYICTNAPEGWRGLPTRHTHDWDGLPTQAYGTHTNTQRSPTKGATKGKRCGLTPYERIFGPSPLFPPASPLNRTARADAFIHRAAATAGRPWCIGAALRRRGCPWVSRRCMACPPSRGSALAGWWCSTCRTTNFVYQSYFCVTVVPAVHVKVALTRMAARGTRGVAAGFTFDDQMMYI